VHHFFGPWDCTMTNQEGHFLERFEIVGSNGADGMYIPAGDGTPFDFHVEGSAWTVDFQAKLGDEDWFSYDPVRTTAIVSPQGLTVTLASEQIVLPGAMVFNHHLVLRCVSTDPALNPPEPFIPWDFSLPD
jgi:hypothetical protein